MSKPSDPFPFLPTPVPPDEAPKVHRGINAPGPHGALPAATPSPATRRGPGLFARPEPAAPVEPQPTELLSARTVELVRWSWGKVMPISDAAAALFYGRLFEMDPSVRPLFKSDITEQKKKLMQTLGVAVDGLGNLGKLVPVLQALGVRHRGYMVADHHYDTVGGALLWTLREGLGDDFTSEVEGAWKQVYGVIADVMKAAANADNHPPANEAAKADVRPAMKEAAKVDVRPAMKEAAKADVRPAMKEAAKADVRPAVKQAAAAPVHAAEPARQALAPAAVATNQAVEAARTLVGVTAPWQMVPGTRSPPSPHTIELVQRSWAHVMPISDAAAALFYGRLFEMDPSVRPLFKSDITEQKKKLMQTLGVAVDGLNNLSKLVSVLQALGARHHGYMVAAHHYDLVGGALLWTLQEGLGDKFTVEVEAAWKEVYGLIADVMKNAAAQTGARPGAQETAAATQAPRGDAPPAAQPRAAAMVDEEDATTLHRLGRSELDEPAPGGARSSVPQGAGYRERLSDSSSTQTSIPPDEITRSPYRPRAELSGPRQPHPSAEPAGFRMPAAAPVELGGLRGVLLPVSAANGQDMVLNVHVKLDSPAAAPAPRLPPPPPQGGAVAGLLVALLCIASSLGTAMVFSLSPVDREGRAPLFPLFAAPLVLLVLVLSSFALGHLLGRRAGPGREGGPPGHGAP